MAKRYKKFGKHTGDTRELGKPKPSGNGYHGIGENRETGAGYRSLGGYEPTAEQGFHSIGTKGLARVAGTHPGRATAMARAARIQPTSLGLSGRAMPEPGQFRDESYSETLARYGASNPVELGLAQQEELRGRAMRGRNPYIFEAVDGGDGRPQIQKKDRKSRAEDFDQQLLAEDAGATSPFTFRQFLRTPGPYPDENIQDIWQDLPDAAKIGYRNKKRNYQDNLFKALTARKRKFETLDEYEEFLQGVDGYSDTIGAAARDLGVNTLKTVDPVLFEQLQGFQKVDTAERNSFARWAKRNPTPASQLSPELQTEIGFEENELSRSYDDPVDRAEFESDSSVDRYFIDPTTNEIAIEEPPEPTLSEQMQEQFTAMSKYLPEGMRVVPNDKGGFDVEEIPDVPRTPEELAASFGKYNEWAEGSGAPQKIPFIDPETGELAVYEPEEEEEPERMDAGNPIFQTMSPTDRSQNVRRIMSLLHGIDPDEETAPYVRRNLPSLEAAQEDKRKLIQKGEHEAKELGLRLVMESDEDYIARIESGDETENQDRGYALIVGSGEDENSVIVFYSASQYRTAKEWSP